MDKKPMFDWRLEPQKENEMAHMYFTGEVSPERIMPRMSADVDAFLSRAKAFEATAALPLTYEAGLIVSDNAAAAMSEEQIAAIGNASNG